MTDELQFLNTGYEEKYGFKEDTPAVFSTKPGISEDVIRQISAKKDEPAWMLDFRLKAFKMFLAKPMPEWGANLSVIDFDKIIYYLKPEGSKAKSWDDVPDKIKNTFERLGIPEAERKFLGGVGAQFESETVYHKLREDLEKKGVIFLDTDTALKTQPELFKQWFSKVVPPGDNKFAALNSAVWSGGTFIYIPKGVHVDIPLQAYFRINAQNMGQFERTLIIADKDASVHYIEGCLPAGELIAGESGFMPIEDVQKNNVVINSAGEKTSVKKTMIRPYNGDLVHITPVSVGNQFSLTPEHPVLAVKRETVIAGIRKNRKLNDVSLPKLINATPEFVEAGALSKGDFLVVPINVFEQDAISLSAAHLKLLGYYLAEGHCGMINGCEAVVLSFSDQEQEVVDDAKKAVQKICGKLPSEYHNPEKHELRLTVYSRELFDFCKKHCRKYADHKLLSQDLMYLPPAKQKILLDAYYLGDGSEYSSSKRAGIVKRALTVSRYLAYQIQQLLLRQGIFASINVRKAFVEMMKNGRSISHKEAYVIYYQQQKKLFAVKRVGNSFFVPIRKIERITYSGNVYNFEVVREPNTYLVKGFAVHNCTAPVYSTDSLHSAVVELVALPGARIRYTTIQNWSSDVYNLVTKRAFAYENSIVEWIDGNLGSKITMKYPSVVLLGKGARADILSVAYAGKGQHQDAGGKAIHLAPNTSSRIVSKSVCKDGGRTSYRGLLKVAKNCPGVVSSVRCDALLLDEKSRSDTYPTMLIDEDQVTIGHEASVGKVGVDQLHYLMSRGLSETQALALIVLGFISEFTKELPMEYAIELNKLIHLNMEGSIG